MARSRRGDLAVVPNLERELDELYGLPLGEFTAARNELAKRLKKAGQTDDGDRVAKLTKPPISAWAVNQLTRREPDRVRELLEAGAEVVDAQKAALAGKGADRFDEASRRHRDAIRGLVPAAVAVLDAEGHRPSDTIKERISSSLRAASMDPEGRSLLEHGRLEEDFESAGLGLLAGFTPAAAAAPASADERRAARLREARQAAEDARATADERAGEAARADRDAEEAKRTADRATDRARALAKEAQAAEKAAQQAQKALERLERA